LWRERTSKKGFSNALLVVWTFFDVKPQENWMIAAAKLAMDRNVVCRHGTSLSPA
jgi:hypothetical protein